MAKNKKIMLDVGLNLQEAIKDYEKLIQEFRNKGASPKAMIDITKQFAQIQQAANKLQAQLRQGFTSSKGLVSFQDSLSKLQGDFINLDGSLKNILANYQDFSNTVSKETQAMSKSIKNGINEQNKALNELRRNMAKGAGLKNKDALSGIVSDETFNTAIANFRERLRASIAEINNQINQEILESRVKNGVQAIGTAVKNTAEYKDKDVEGLKQGIQQTVAKAFEKGSEEGLKAAAEEIQKQLGAKEFSTASIQSILQAAYEDKGIQANSKLIGKRNSAEQTLSGLESIETRLINSDEYKNRLTEIQNLLQQSAAAEIQAARAKEQDATAQAKLNTQIDQARPKFDNNINDLLRSASAATEVARKSESLAKEFKNLFSRFTYMFSITSIFNTFRTQLRNTLNDIRNLDKAYSSIAYVSNETVSSLWKTYDQYSNMAEKLGQSTADVIKASAIYRQQGLDTTQALELTTDTMKLATIAGNDYSKATQEMTAALRGFKMEMDEGAHVSDVYSELAAHAAASVDGIAQAMSRTASIANSAGMSFENTSAFLTQMIETTQESAENIGFQENS